MLTKLVKQGVLSNGSVIAVKRIRNIHTIDEKLFYREVNSLLKVDHPNIARFLGFCSNTEKKPVLFDGKHVLAEIRERLLCFEYLNNGSLDTYIDGIALLPHADELRGLEWNARYKIIKGICLGLQYLHEEKHIIHMDLKPSNILLDDDMLPRITDFGLSRPEENSQTLRYCAPECREGKRMSVKSDIYSLGVIILELVTGRRSVNTDNDSVLRRWMSRWGKLKMETTLGHQQVTKCIQIGLLCQNFDPEKRPSISDIIHDLNKMESESENINDVNEPTLGQIPCSLELTNDTNDYFGFYIQQIGLLKYHTVPDRGIVPPRSICTVSIALQAPQKAPQDVKYFGEFSVKSTKVNKDLTSEAITKDMFGKNEGEVVDEVKLTVLCDKPPLPEESIAPQEIISKTSSSSSSELIQMHPLELRLPFNHKRMVSSSVQLTNVTDYYVAFIVVSPYMQYTSSVTEKILSPRSVVNIVISRAAQNGAPCPGGNKEMVVVVSTIVNEEFKTSDITNDIFKELPGRVVHMLQLDVVLEASSKASLPARLSRRVTGDQQFEEEAGTTSTVLRVEHEEAHHAASGSSQTQGDQASDSECRTEEGESDPHREKSGLLQKQQALV
ncbi:serine/threonine-protein kinase SIK1-like [Lolium rigidum]|uniref:serine/threonine-protein kinase SIK1-like n=1 Tax=Lolium rigidum TaxID=89674 RepID=UPI001F5E13DA|nr:serine/threonine-protein kinase SIK1-like [Lolium rigidum]